MGSLHKDYIIDITLYPILVSIGFELPQHAIVIGG